LLSNIETLPANLMLSTEIATGIKLDFCHFFRQLIYPLCKKTTRSNRQDL